MSRYLKSINRHDKFNKTLYEPNHLQNNEVGDHKEETAVQLICLFLSRTVTNIFNGFDDLKNCCLRFRRTLEYKAASIEVTAH